MFDVIKPIGRELSTEILVEINRVCSLISEAETAFFASSTSIFIIAFLFFVLLYIHKIKDQVKVNYILDGQDTFCVRSNTVRNHYAQSEIY